ncbi:Gfo/Idh/MocA family oxidoreductase [Clostridium sp. BJN0001]|uniref:Gfo/Idh/MocA family protein n=1 Tax=Clostridium sp. BJN0001 TaxID=2930219 RepID=UPI001FD50456|nr:Gfo/Idh/MocA family oxidoreductase [Clostridium sp. BJN0001]
MKIAIAGSGMIVPTFTDAAKNISDIQICAIFCREKSIEKAKKIAKENNFSKIYTDYDEMLKDSEIEFIYIALPNSLHYEFSLKALKAGKNLICEKPFTMSKKQTENLINIASENKLFIFEAITTIYMPNYKLIKEHLNKIGNVKIVSCNFTQYSSRYDNYLKKIIAPVFNPDLGGGVLPDLNIYNIHFVSGLFGSPTDAYYFANLGFNKVDTSGIIILKYDKFTASLTAAKDCFAESSCYIEGDNGYIKLNGTANEMNEIEIKIRDKEIKKYNVQKYSNRMTYELNEFNKIYKEKDFKKCSHFLSHTKDVIDIFEKALKNIK